MGPGKVCKTIGGPRSPRYESMNSPQFDSPQMEFGFAQTVTVKRWRKGRARKSSAQVRAEKLAGTTGAPGERALKSHVNAPLGDGTTPVGRIDWTEAPGVFGSEWIEGVCGNIRNASDLREALSLTACYLADLIDREIDVRGHNETWKQEYEGYCWTQYFSLTIETETELEELRALWWGAGIVLSADNGSNDRSDWELFEDLCVFEADFGDLDRSGAEASYMDFLATFLWNLHEHLFRASGGTFTERLQASKP
jgi:hypothetical protein